MTRMVFQCMLLILLATAVCLSMRLYPVDRSRISTAEAEVPISGRFGRSPTILANAAKVLLNGAVKTDIQMKGFNVFVKHGSTSTAYREFMATAKTEVLKYNNFFGNRVFLSEADKGYITYIPKDKLVGNKPTITIYHWDKAWAGKTGNYHDKIIYE